MNSEQPTKIENNIEDVDISKLNFEQLKEARELGEKSLQRTERGFMMVNGTELFLKETGGDAHTLMNESAVDKLPAYIANNDDSILNDSKNEGMDREVIIQELEKVLTEEFGYIVIE